MWTPHPSACGCHLLPLSRRRRPRLLRKSVSSPLSRRRRPRLLRKSVSSPVSATPTAFASQIGQFPLSRRRRPCLLRKSVNSPLSRRRQPHLLRKSVSSPPGKAFFFRLFCALPILISEFRVFDTLKSACRICGTPILVWQGSLILLSAGRRKENHFIFYLYKQKILLIYISKKNPPLISRLRNIKGGFRRRLTVISLSLRRAHSRYRRQMCF